MKLLKKIWDSLNGNKTTIGMVIVLVAQGVKVFAPGFITPDQSNFIETVGLTLGGAGLFHKGIKNNNVQNAINKINKQK